MKNTFIRSSKEFEREVCISCFIWLTKILQGLQKSDRRKSEDKVGKKMLA